MFLPHERGKPISLYALGPIVRLFHHMLPAIMTDLYIFAERAHYWQHGRLLALVWRMEMGLLLYDNSCVS